MKKNLSSLRKSSLYCTITVIHSSLLPFIQLNWVTLFFVGLKAYSHSVCARFMRDVLSNKRLKKAIMQFHKVLGKISKIQTARQKWKFQKGYNNLNVNWKIMQLYCFIVFFVVSKFCKTNVFFSIPEEPEYNSDYDDLT